jgi:hypothetical protein
MSFLFGSSKTTTPTLTGQGQQLYNMLNGGLGGIFNDPLGGLGSIQTAGMQQINSSYQDAPRLMTRLLASRGYGSSGNMGDALYKTNLARLGALNSYQGTIANLASSRQMNAAQILNSMLGTQVGSKTTTIDPFSAFEGIGSMLMSPMSSSSILSKIFNGGGGGDFGDDGGDGENGDD